MIFGLLKPFLLETTNDSFVVVVSKFDILQVPVLYPHWGNHDQNNLGSVPLEKNFFILHLLLAAVILSSTLFLLSTDNANVFSLYSVHS